MLRNTNLVFRGSVHSHQFHPVSNPLHGHGYGRNYTQNLVKYASKGWGIGNYSARKDNRFVPRRFNARTTEAEKFDFTMPISRATKTLSPHFRPFALADGGVLFIHPSSREIMTWNHEVLGKEQKASGLGNVHDDTRSKIQSLIADNTIEHVSIGQWRQLHIQRLMRKTLNRYRPQTNFAPGDDWHMERGQNGSN